MWSDLGGINDLERLGGIHGCHCFDVFGRKFGPNTLPLLTHFFLILFLGQSFAKIFK